MTSLDISLTDDVRALAGDQVTSGRYPWASDYVASLIRQDRERAERERVKGELLERLRGAPAKDVTDEDFDCIRGRVGAAICRMREV